MKISVIAALLLILSTPLSARVKVIYGTDDRLDLYETSDNLYLDLAKSTAAYIPESYFSDDPNDATMSKISSSTLGSRGLCEGEKFVDQPTAAACSGFLVGPNLLVTAGHCMRSFRDCTSNKWVFDYGLDNPNRDLSRVPKKNIYSCVKIIEQKLESSTMNDFAFIQLDRNVEDREPLKFRTEGKVQKGDPLVVIGHPTGLPTKIADNAIVRRNDNSYFFVSNLDTFGGNSGSAVFNANTGLVEGILVRGEQDYERDFRRGCRTPKKCKENSCRGEDVTRITNISKLMEFASKN